MVLFRNRSNCLDAVSDDFLKSLVALGGYCTALQAQALFPGSPTQIRGRLRNLERLGFLRRITKYPVVYQVTKSTTRLLGKDSSSRRRHELATIQARLLGLHFYLEARAWPAEFVLDHDQKVAMFRDLAGCPLTVLPQRGGQPYLREYFLLWDRDWRLCLTMIDSPLPGALSRLRRFIREFLQLLRYLQKEPDLLVVTADQGRSHVYERLLQRHRTIQKLGLGQLRQRIKAYAVKPPVPSVTGLTWRGESQEESLVITQDSRDHSYGDSHHNRMTPTQTGELILD